MQSDLLLGDQMYHLTHSKVEIPHSENADVEYYTTYPKTPEKGRETPTSRCTCAHPREPPSGSPPVAMVLLPLYYILHYYYSKKKAREPVAYAQNILPVT